MVFLLLAIILSSACLEIRAWGHHPASVEYLHAKHTPGLPTRPLLYCLRVGRQVMKTPNRLPYMKTVCPLLSERPLTQPMCIILLLLAL